MFPGAKQVSAGAITILAIAAFSWPITNASVSSLGFSFCSRCPTLLRLTGKSAHIAPAHIGWWLMGSGAVGLIGNWLAGQWVDQKPVATTAVFSVVLAVGMASSMAFAGANSWFVIALAIWEHREYRALSNLLISQRLAAIHARVTAIDSTSARSSIKVKVLRPPDLPCVHCFLFVG